MAKQTVIFQGTFDPFTNGHLAVVKQALQLFGQVRILLLVNPDKTPLFLLDERKELIQAATADLPGVSVDSFDGLLVDYMRAHHLTVCVRGVRSAEDAAYEMHNDHLSQALYPALYTLLIACPGAYQAVSSSAVKAACMQGNLPAGWVPEVVEQALKQKFPHIL